MDLNPVDVPPAEQTEPENPTISAVDIQNPPSPVIDFTKFKAPIKRASKVLNTNSNYKRKAPPTMKEATPVKRKLTVGLVLLGFHLTYYLCFPNRFLYILRYNISYFCKLLSSYGPALLTVTLNLEGVET